MSTNLYNILLKHFTKVELEFQSLYFDSIFVEIGYKNLSKSKYS